MYIRIMALSSLKNVPKTHLRKLHTKKPARIEFPNTDRPSNLCRRGKGEVLYTTPSGSSPSTNNMVRERSAGVYTKRRMPVWRKKPDRHDLAGVAAGLSIGLTFSVSYILLQTPGKLRSPSSS